MNPTDRGIMAIPTPLMLILERLNRYLMSPSPEVKWLDAMPEEVRHIDPRLLWMPLLQRGLVAEAAHGVHITANGVLCMSFGFMPMAAVPVDDDHLELMSHSPSPEELAESVDGGLIVVHEMPAEAGPGEE